MLPDNIFVYIAGGAVPTAFLILVYLEGYRKDLATYEKARIDTVLNKFMESVRIEPFAEGMVDKPIPLSEIDVYLKSNLDSNSIGMNKYIHDVFNINYDSKFYLIELGTMFGAYCCFAIVSALMGFSSYFTISSSIELVFAPIFLISGIIFLILLVNIIFRRFKLWPNVDRIDKNNKRA
jgi:hypothetical protein